MQKFKLQSIYMEFSAQQIAELLNGSIDGKPSVVVNSLSKIEEGKPKTLSFLANPAYTHYIYDTDASVVIVNKDFVPEKPVKATMIRVENAHHAFVKLLDIYNQMKHNKTGVSKMTFVHEKATIGENVYIGAHTYIGENAVIGDNVKIYPNVTIGDNTKIDEGTTIFAGVHIYSDNAIGKNCTLHSGVVIGADGFGFIPKNDKNYKKVAQIGNVIIEDDVEIGSNTTIDRATLGSTIIRRGVKLDNLIQIAHNVEIGANTVIVSQTGIAGSTKIGENCMIGGQVGIIDHLTIGNNVKIAAQSGIQSNLKDGAVVQGSPAFEVGNYKKSYVSFKQLPEIRKKIFDLEKQLEELKHKKHYNQPKY